MDRLVGSASPERAEPSRFPELARWASRAEPSSAQLVSTPTRGSRVEVKMEWIQTATESNMDCLKLGQMQDG
jgi:hypothetical protein